MEGQQITLNDGTIIPNGRVGYAEGVLWCFFSGMSFARVAVLFTDPERTARIVFQFGEMEHEYTGFVNCTNINVDVDGQFSVALKRGANDAS